MGYLENGIDSNIPSFVISVFALRCHELVCGLWLCYFLVILAYFFYKMKVIISGIETYFTGQITGLQCAVFYPSFSNHFKKILKRFKSMGYNINMGNVGQLAYCAIKPGTDYSFGFPIYVYDVGTSQKE